MLSFGQRLKTLRREADLSQAELAEAIGVSVHSVSKWECDSNMPDASLLVPLSVVLGVTTDCLLGAGTNENEDLKEYEEEIGFQHYDHDIYDYGANLKRYETAKAFLKKYPLNYKVKLDCIYYLYDLLHPATWPKAYKIPADEFEQLYDEGIRMIRSLIDRDKDPSRLIHARKMWITLLCMRDRFDEAEQVALELPEISAIRKKKLASIAGWKNDLDGALELRKEVCSKIADELIYALFIVGRRSSMLGNARKSEAIEAWRDMKKVTEALVEVFSKYGPEEHFDKARALMQAICKISNESIAIDDTETALLSLEEATEAAVRIYGEIKAAGADKELLEKAKASFCDIPLMCYNSVISDDDNVLSREDRFKACKARLETLE